MIQNTIPALFLLATDDLPRVWGRFDNQRPADGTNQMLLVASLAALVALVMLIWFRSSRRPPRRFVSNSASKLFRELCRAHGLNHSHRQLLKRLAAANNLASAALVFVEPRYFDAANLPPSLQSSSDDLRRLRMQLFG